jgi:hypothetical protein
MGTLHETALLGVTAESLAKSEEDVLIQVIRALVAVP